MTVVSFLALQVSLLGVIIVALAEAEACHCRSAVYRLLKCSPACLAGPAVHTLMLMLFWQQMSMMSMHCTSEARNQHTVHGLKDPHAHILQCCCSQHELMLSTCPEGIPCQRALVLHSLHGLELYAKTDQHLHIAHPASGKCLQVYDIVEASESISSPM